MDNQKYDLEDIKTDLRIIYILRNNLGSIFGGSEEFEDYISANELLLECERMLYKRAGILYSKMCIKVYQSLCYEKP